MAVAAAVFDETQRATLEALCDTYVPSVEADTGDPLEHDFMARAARDMQIPAQIEGMMADAMTPDEIAEFAELLDALAARGLRRRCRSRPHADRPRDPRRRTPTPSTAWTRSRR